MPASCLCAFWRSGTITSSHLPSPFWRAGVCEPPNRSAWARGVLNKSFGTTAIQSRSAAWPTLWRRAIFGRWHWLAAWLAGRQPVVAFLLCNSRLALFALSVINKQTDTSGWESVMSAFSSSFPASCSFSSLHSFASPRGVVWSRRQPSNNYLQSSAWQGSCSIVLSL
ncbi:uncharacterized protein BKA78DRAFT_87592 [Phyllosticta capitalensis]|uniref:uncharacterized protein n=1 Tax=Phyllosticta capitalensis TaxID=121624 RepID=UPI0031302B13